MKQWVIQEDRSESDEDNGARTLHQTHVMSYAHVKWFRNAALDAVRHAARPTKDWIPLGSTGGGGTGLGGLAAARTPSGAHGPSATNTGVRQAPSGGPHFMVACDNDCAGGGYNGPVAPTIHGTDPGCGANVTAHVNAPPANPAVNLVYQHGIRSAAQTWCDMSVYLRSRFIVGSADLTNRFHQDQQAGYTGQYVFVGHSNGGIVSRFTAQTLNGAYGGVSGVVSVSTPHGGVNLANLRRDAMFGLLAVPLLAQGGVPVCQHVPLYLRGPTHSRDRVRAARRARPVCVEQSAPVLQEMTPSATFHQYINGRGDPNYLGVAVVNESWE